MSRSKLAAVAVLGAALALGVGYWLGLSHQPLAAAALSQQDDARECRSGRGRRRGPRDSPEARRPRADGGAGVPARAARTGVARTAFGTPTTASFLDLGEIDLVLLAEWWAGFDPEAAFEWTHREWTAEHPAVVVQVFRAWGRSDPAAALEAAEECPDADASPPVRPRGDRGLGGVRQARGPGVRRGPGAGPRPAARHLRGGASQGAARRSRGGLSLGRVASRRRRRVQAERLPAGGELRGGGRPRGGRRLGRAPRGRGVRSRAAPARRHPLGQARPGGRHALALHAAGGLEPRRRRA